MAMFQTVNMAVKAIAKLILIRDWRFKYQDLIGLYRGVTHEN